MASTLVFLFSLLLLLLPLPSLSQSCTSQAFSSNRLFATCNDLPHLSAALHWTYNATNSTLSIAFVAPPSRSGGWVAWALNPTGTGMVGAQAVVGLRQSSGGSLVAKTFNITAYGPVTPSPIAFETWGLEAEENTGGVMTVFATIKLPHGVTKMNQVWQVGPSSTGGIPHKHDFGVANLNAKGTLDVVGGQSSGGTDSRSKERNSCTSQAFSSNRLFATCNDLPHLSAALHWTYNATNSTLSIAFVAPPSRSGGWVAWALNPTGSGMVGAQAVVGLRESSGGSLVAKTFNITAYGPVTPSPIAFETWGLEAEESTGGVMTVFATIKLPRGVTKMNQVWQVGPSSSGGIPDKHDFGVANLNAKGTLDVVSGQSSGGTDSRLKERNIHGILNAVSWGILIPIGAIIARYLKKFESLDSAWFYLHVVCQLSGYALGVTGWAIGLNLGKKSKGIQYTTHRNLGIALFSVATLQITALFLRPKKDHKYRMYWNRYHQVVGIAVIVLGIINVFKGLEILSPARKWKDAYIVVLCVLAAITLILEATTCFMAWRRKLDSSDSTKKYNASGAANDHLGFQQPLSA